MLEQLQPNELMTLVAGVVLFPFVVASVRTLQPRVRTYMMATYAALLVSEFCTNLEAFILPDVLNLTEHVSWTIAAVMFTLTIAAIRRYGLEGSVRG